MTLRDAAVATMIGQDFHRRITVVTGGLADAASFAQPRRRIA